MAAQVASPTPPTAAATSTPTPHPTPDQPTPSSITTTVQTPKPSNTTTSTTTFRFFSLPRELRDEIYDHALTFKHKLAPQNHIRLRLRRAPSPPLTLVSRLFRHEYLLRAAHHTTLVIVDRDEYLGDPITLPCPLKTWLGRVEIHLALACNETCHTQPHFYGHTHAAPPLPFGSAVRDGCRIRREMRMHAKWVAGLCAEMRGLREVVLKVVLDPHEEVAGCERLLVEDQWRFTGLECLKTWEVDYCEYEVRSESRWNFARPRRRAMRWVGGEGSSGWLERVPEVEADVERKGEGESVSSGETVNDDGEAVVQSVEEVEDEGVVKDV